MTGPGKPCFLLLIGLAAAAILPAASDPVAARLAKEARKAQDAGQIVQAYLLYSAAAARDPENTDYKIQREAIAPLAKLLTKANIAPTPDISAQLEAAQNAPADPTPPIERASLAEWEATDPLGGLPPIQPDSSRHNFDIRLDEKQLIQQVTSAYKMTALWDPQLEDKPEIFFEVNGADFKSAMEALTAATGTFVFPVSPKVVFFAPNTELKRNEYEPVVVLTVPLPDAVSEKDVIEAANAVRGALGMRAIGWDSVNRTVMIRDHISKARVARSALEALLLPKGQLSLEVQFLTFDTDKSYHYGASLQTTYELLNFGASAASKSILLPATKFSTYFTFGGGATIFGLGLADATLFASYSSSFSRNLYDATIVVDNGQTADFHVGDKYPIPQSLYTGYQQSTPSIYNPIGQFTLEDLGLVLKITPHINGEGDIDLDVDAEYKALGTQTFNSVPAVLEREFKGTASMRQGEWAVLAGMDSVTRSLNRNGFPFFSNIPGIGQVLAENTRDNQTSNTLIVIRPTISRLPMASWISPQFLLGPERGERVIL